MTVIALVQVIIVYIGGELLRTTPISLESWGIALVLAILVIPIDFIRKLFVKKIED